MSRHIFRCAENPEHVKKVNITIQDLQSMREYFEQVDMPCSWSKKDIDEACGDGSDISMTHDVAHSMCDDLVIAWKANHPALKDEMFQPMMIELEQKQIACKNGEDHD